MLILIQFRIRIIRGCGYVNKCLNPLKNKHLPIRITVLATMGKREETVGIISGALRRPEGYPYGFHIPCQHTYQHPEKFILKLYTFIPEDKESHVR